MSLPMLLEACRIEPEDLQLTPEILAELSAAYTLAQQATPGREGGHLPHAVTLLAAALGRMPRFTPTHLPFGFGGPPLKSRRWVDLDRMALLMIQLIGLCQPRWEAERVTFEAQSAVSTAAALGFIEKKNYDGWLPGMAPGSGWRTAVAATPYGLARARQAAAEVATVPAAPAYPWRQTAPIPGPVVAPVPAADPAQDHAPAPAMPGSPPPALPVAAGPPAPPSNPPAGTPLREDRYAWARQIELVRATNQVLGEGELNPGVLSKACKKGEMQTNQKSGRASMVAVKSYLLWLSQKRELPKEELDQIRNAIIGEISARL